MCLDKNNYNMGWEHLKQFGMNFIWNALDELGCNEIVS
jgi:hypothetical protein